MKLLAIVLVTVAGVLTLIAAATFSLDEWLMWAAAVPAGIGGALLGDRGMGWLIEHGYVKKPWG